MRVQSTLTDWQGKLRVSDVVGDTLRILVQRPALALLVPTGCLALCGWLGRELDVAFLVSPLVESWAWDGVRMLGVQLVLAVPMLALSWALLSAAVLEPARVRRTARLARATVVATSIGLAMLAAAFSIGFFAILLIPVVGIAVPASACERIGPLASLRRAASLTDGNRLRLIGAWLLLQLLVLVGVLLIGMAVFVLAHATGGELPLGTGWAIALLFEALSFALATSVTTALCIAAYGRLRQARVELDVETWVEVFR
jgi:hypothetical protein